MILYLRCTVGTRAETLGGHLKASFFVSAPLLLLAIQINGNMSTWSWKWGKTMAASTVVWRKVFLLCTGMQWSMHSITRQPGVYWSPFCQCVPQRYMGEVHCGPNLGRHSEWKSSRKRPRYFSQGWRTTDLDLRRKYHYNYCVDLPKSCTRPYQYTI